MMLDGCALELRPRRQRRSTTKRGAGCRLVLLRLVAIMPAGTGQAGQDG